MKHCLNLVRVLTVLGALASPVLTSPLHADNVDSQTLSVVGRAIAALEVTAVEALRFGEVALPNGAEGESAPTVTITVSDQATGAFAIAYTENGSPDVSAASTGTGSLAAEGNRSEIGPAQLAATGQPNFNYVVTGGFAAMTPNDTLVSVD